MVTYVKAHSEKFVDNCAGDVYTIVADRIMSLSSITSLR